VNTAIGRKMLSNEQILFKSVRLLENLDKLTNPESETTDLYSGSESVLREVTEGEMEAIESILDDIALDGALSLGGIFKDKTRLIVDFPTKDVATEIGKFISFFETQGYEIDWDKGMISAIQEYPELKWDSDSKGRQTKSKKVTMKIGKFLAKLVDLYKKQKVYIDKIASPPPKFDETRFAALGIRKTISEILTDEELKRFYQIHNLLNVYLPDMQNLLDLYKSPVLSRNRSMRGDYDAIKRVQLEPTAAADWAAGLSDYWQKNAGFIKEKVSGMRDDTYSIIVTRHPIDVLRMSDFEDITSCHSPPSQEGIYQSYYKCAVAEAQGHGAVAYVVLTDNLLNATGAKNIEEAESVIQSGEIFEDQTRGGDIGLGITPESRIRLRKFAYYQDSALYLVGGSLRPKNWNDGSELAVPEIRVYGRNIPGLLNRITSWASAMQDIESIQDFPKTESGKLNGESFYLFGGTYSDTTPNSMLSKFIFDSLQSREYIEGTVQINSDDEDALSPEDLGDPSGILESQVEAISEEWNARYSNTFVEARIEDDGADEFYISASATLHLKWEASEWSSYPNPGDVDRWSAEHINERMGDIFDPTTARVSYLPDKQGVKWSCEFNLEHPDNGGSGQYLVMSEDYENMCASVDLQDDKRDMYKAMLEEFFKNEGYMSGAEFAKLARDIEDRDINSYEWDLETDGGYDESYEATAKYSFYYEPADWGMDPLVMIKIIDSREFKISLKQKILYAARKEVDSEYYLDYGARVSQAGEGSDIKLTVTFMVNADQPDEMCELFRELVTGDADDEDNLAADFNETLVEMKKLYVPDVKSDNINENLVKSWRNFIS
jgi:hypothetical protein